MKPPQPEPALWHRAASRGARSKHQGPATVRAFEIRLLARAHKPVSVAETGDGFETSFPRSRQHLGWRPIRASWPRPGESWRLVARTGTQPLLRGCGSGLGCNGCRALSTLHCRLLAFCLLDGRFTVWSLWEVGLDWWQLAARHALGRPRLGSANHERSARPGPVARYWRTGTGELHLTIIELCLFCARTVRMQ